MKWLKKQARSSSQCHSCLLQNLTLSINFAKHNEITEASLVYILSGQKFIKMPKMVNFDEFWKPNACGQTVLPDRSGLIG